ncbi:hypothetical protein AOLI_G00023040 [Acnodon oligacanthus]
MCGLQEHCQVVKPVKTTLILISADCKGFQCKWLKENIFQLSCLLILYICHDVFVTKNYRWFDI